MKLTNKERKLVKEYAKKLVSLKEGAFAINNYNFTPGYDFKSFSTQFEKLIQDAENFLEDIHKNLNSKNRILKRASVLFQELSDIHEDFIDLYSDYEQEGKSGSYLTPVTDPDTLSAISKIKK